MDHTDFIGVYPNAVSAQDCNRIIEYYERYALAGLVMDRQEAELMPMKTKLIKALLKLKKYGSAETHRAGAIRTPRHGIDRL